MSNVIISYINKLSEDMNKHLYDRNNQTPTTSKRMAPGKLKPLAPEIYENEINTQRETIRDLAEKISRLSEKELYMTALALTEKELIPICSSDLSLKPELISSCRIAESLRTLIAAVKIDRDKDCLSAEFFQFRDYHRTVNEPSKLITLPKIDYNPQNEVHQEAATPANMKVSYWLNFQ